MTADRVANAYGAMDEIPPMQVPEEAMRLAAQCAREQAHMTRILEAVKWIGAWAEAEWPESAAKRDLRARVQALLVRIAFVERPPHGRQAEMWERLADACDQLSRYFAEARATTGGKS